MKRLKIITILMFFIISMMVYIPISKAAALTISTSQSNAKEGDSVTITVNGNGISGRVDLSVESGNGTLSEKSVWVDNSKATTTLTITGENDVRVLATPTDASDSATSASYTQATSATIKVSKNETATQTTNEQNNNNNNSEATVTPTETKKSNNANLSDFGFTPNDFRGFKPGTINYNTTVPNDVEQVTVYAKLQDKKAKITSGTGVQKLNVGENKLSVVVTAEDGTTKTYTVNVTREEAKNDEKNDENTTPNEAVNEEIANEKEAGDLIKLEVEGYKLTPAFSPTVYEYKLDVSGDVKDLNVIAEGASHDVSIELVGNTDLQDGENVITVLVYNQETKKNTTYQILVNKVTANTEDMNNAMNDAIKKANFIRKILIGIAIFVIAAIAIFVIVRRRYYSEDYEDEEEEDLSEDRLNLDDEEEFFNRVNKDAFRKKNEKKETEEETEEETEDDRDEEKNNNIEKQHSSFEEKKIQKEELDTARTRKKGKHF